MKGFLKYSLASFICVILLSISCLPANAFSAHTQQEAIGWVQSQVGKGLDMDYQCGNQCVDLILAYYDYLGVPRSSGNAADYTYNALPAGWQRIQGAQPQPGDILVYTGGTNNYGHVAIYESDYISYHQNFNNHSYVERITCRYNVLTTPYWGVIRPDFNKISLIPADLSDSFNAYVKMQSSDMPMVSITANINVELGNKGNSIDGAWHFEKQPDGSYEIASLKFKDQKMVLDVAGGITTSGNNIQVCAVFKEDNIYQRWYIYKNGNGYRFVPKSAPNLSLDVDSGHTSPGTNIQIYTHNESVAQCFSIDLLPNTLPTGISASDFSLKVGESKQLTCKLVPEHLPDSMQDITYRSLNPEIASVQSNGIVRGKAKGYTEIVCTSRFDPSISTRITVTVTNSSGWKQTGNHWEYYYDDGSKAVNAWVTDSLGWCYLDQNGYMATDCWVSDSTGWCYLDSTGHPMTNCWARDYHGWCYLDSEGHMVYNRWAEDSLGWTYLGEDGYILKNCWVLDSFGWCYLNDNGYILYDSWVKDSTGWCYVDHSGHASVNQWVSDSYGWCYLDSSGHIAANTWVMDSIGWCYVGPDGYLICNGYAQDSNGWHYMDETGHISA